jgi:hypothetical protein
MGAALAESMRGGFCCRWSDRAMVLSILPHFLAISEKRKCVFCVTNLPVSVYVF